MALMAARRWVTKEVVSPWARAAGRLTSSEAREPKAIGSLVALNAASMNRSAVFATFRQQERNGAFVLMEYFGYLRRDPNAAPDSDLGGYNFWLNKLNQFGGNYLDAEMVRAFIISLEYRQRFGQ